MNSKTTTSNRAAQVQRHISPLLFTLMLLMLWISQPAHAAKVTSSSLIGGWARVSASVWCFPNAPPAPPSATGSAIGSFSIPGTPPNGLPLPPGCNPATFANAEGGSFWQDNSAWGAAGGDTVDGSLDLLSMLTPVSYSSGGSFEVSASLLDSTSVLFHVKYANSDIGSGTQQYWYDYLTEMPLADPMVQIGESGEYFITIMDPDGWEHIALDAEGAATSLPTPEPGTLGIVGSVVIAMGGYLRRRLSMAS